MEASGREAVISGEPHYGTWQSPNGPERNAPRGGTLRRDRAGIIAVLWMGPRPPPPWSLLGQHDVERGPGERPDSLQPVPLHVEREVRQEGVRGLPVVVPSVLRVAVMLAPPASRSIVPLASVAVKVVAV
jgi:hypothetical protein